MVWLGNFQRQRRPLDEPKNDSEQKRQRIFNSVEVGFYSSNGEHNKFAGDMLPDGWTYDEVSTTPLSLAKPKTFGQLKKVSWSEIMSLHVTPRGDCRCHQRCPH